MMPHGRRLGRLVNAKGEELRVIRLEVPPRLHDAFRVQAARERMSMTALARKCVESYMQHRPRPERDEVE